MADFARLMTEEMGKTLAAAESEVDKCAWVCDFYAENAERFLAHETVATDAAKSFVRYEPLGPVLAIMPWNFPFWQFFRFAAPALMAGNVGAAEARRERPRLGARHRGGVPRGGLAGRRVDHAAGLLGAGQDADPPPGGAGGDPHRQRPGRHGGGRRGGARA